MSESDRYPSAQVTCVTITPHSQYRTRQIFNINSIKRLKFKRLKFKRLKFISKIATAVAVAVAVAAY